MSLASIEFAAASPWRRTFRFTSRERPDALLRMPLKADLPSNPRALRDMLAATMARLHRTMMNSPHCVPSMRRRGQKWFPHVVDADARTEIAKHGAYAKSSKLGAQQLSRGAIGRAALHIRCAAPAPLRRTLRETRRRAVSGVREFRGGVYRGRCQS
jgi:hypothetical protein